MFGAWKKLWDCWLDFNRTRSNSSGDMLRTLKEELAEWTDFDAAGLYLGRCLGIFASDITNIRQVKHVFWSAHPIGESIISFLRELVKAGVLEYDEENLRFRWNQEFQGSWESRCK